MERRTAYLKFWTMLGGRRSERSFPESYCRQSWCFIFHPCFAVTQLSHYIFLLSVAAVTKSNVEKLATASCENQVSLLAACNVLLSNISVYAAEDDLRKNETCRNSVQYSSSHVEILSKNSRTCYSHILLIMLCLPRYL